MNPERGADWVTGKGGRPGVGPSDSPPASSAATALRRLARDIDRLGFHLRLMLAFVALAFFVVIPLEVWFRV